MRRYLVLGFGFDTRASLLTEINEQWDEKVKQQHKENQRKIQVDLMKEHGSLNFDVKLQNFIELGSLPFSVISFHSKFLTQIRNAFIVGAYYPALTGACALGERILNHLLLNLREYYKNTDGYKKIRKKKSFDKWIEAIDILDSWGVFLPDVSLLFKDLSVMRNMSIHFKPDVDKNDRELALKAIQMLTMIIDKQFSPFGGKPWIISGTKGAVFIKKDCENIPFIKTVFLPKCAYVSPFYTIKKWDIETGALKIDDLADRDDKGCDDELKQYYDRGLSDDEFMQLVNKKYGNTTSVK